MKLEVFSTKRNIRSFFDSQKSKNLLTNKALSIGEFFELSIIVPNLKKATQSVQILKMQEAVLKTKNATEILQIPSEFFAFLKNNEYLFSFFKELKREKITTQNLKNQDIYAHYDEHLDILNELEKNYLDLLEKDGFYDDISVVGKYEINLDFIKSFSEICINIDGDLDAFSWDIITKVAEICSVFLNVKSGKFNQKTISQISNLTRLNLAPHKQYQINLSQKQIVFEDDWKFTSRPVLSSIGTRSAQCAFVFDEISEFLRQGFEASKIAVILPDESFGSILQNADKNKMLNFANGISFCDTKEFAIFDSLKTALDLNLDYKFDENYLNKSDILDQKQVLLNFLEIKSEIYNSWQQIYYQICSYNEFLSQISLILDKSDEQIKQIIFEIVFELKGIIEPNLLKFNQIYDLFLTKLKKIKIPSVGGGEITVMGLLESRAEKFDGVVIIDFNDNFVPKRSQKEMFLSSKIRARAGLSSHFDRENLQRFYYESLVKNAKKVSICFVNDEEKIKSRFAKSLNCEEKEKYSQDAYLYGLTSPNLNLNLTKENFIAKHDFFAFPMSFSRLDTYFKSPRAYYYQYVLELGKARSLEKSASIDGALIHKCLEEYFKENKNYFDKDKFTKILQKYGIDRISKYSLIYDLDKFAFVQNEHFSKGFEVFKCEFECKSVYKNINLKGRIDRIDINQKTGEICLIDYKTGSIDNKSLQLAFYEALYGKNAKGFYFDLKDEIEFIPNQVQIDELDTKFDELKAINNTKIDFSKFGPNWQYFEDKLLRLKR